MLKPDIQDVLECCGRGAALEETMVVRVDKVVFTQIFIQLVVDSSFSQLGDFRQVGNRPVILQFTSGSFVFPAW